ncbi:hypothetical protein LMG28614_00138 [Paraburkholderia ultramafica]|uniref:Uncharacterized protein n=1 Tax=Paraburkholderia ultramafica TaxID=1544867 RepID=A0A6S7ASY2_9BURK|nr:hypothetical protein LMG28614_00138 [Paraburkholderia ultramafica]
MGVQSESALLACMFFCSGRRLRKRGCHGTHRCGEPPSPLNSLCVALTAKATLARRFCHRGRRAVIANALISLLIFLSRECAPACPTDALSARVRTTVDAIALSLPPLSRADYADDDQHDRQQGQFDKRGDLNRIVEHNGSPLHDALILRPVSYYRTQSCSFGLLARKQSRAVTNLPQTRRQKCVRWRYARQRTESSGSAAILLPIPQKRLPLREPAFLHVLQQPQLCEQSGNYRSQHHVDIGKPRCAVESSAYAIRCRRCVSNPSPMR